MLLLDNIVFELQRAGGISMVWNAVLQGCLAASDMSFAILDSGTGNENIFYPDFALPGQIIKDTGSLRLRRYRNVHRVGSERVFHSSYFRVHKDRSVKNIVTVHDFVYEKYDRGLRRHVHLMQKHYALKRADAVICVSENTRQDLLSYHPWLENRLIRVVHNGVGRDFSPASEKICNNPYLLYVGGRNAHKNFTLVMNMLNLPIAKELNLHLCIVGGGQLSKEELALAVELGIIDKVRHVGHVENEELNMFYNNAFAFVYPSFYEGFGIPPLEAMAAGCPVICSNKSSIPEVVGDAGLLIEPTDLAMAEDFLQKLTDTQFRLKCIRRGIKQASGFSWEKTGEQTVQLYRELM